MNNRIETELIIDDILSQWAEADAKGDRKKAIKLLDQFVRIMSSIQILIAHATSIAECEALKAGMLQLREAKEELRRLVAMSIPQYQN